MTPEKQHNGSWVLQKNIKGAMSSSPFRVVAEKPNPGTIVECVLTGEFYVKKEGELKKITDGATVRELRVPRSGVIFEQKASG